MHLVSHAVVARDASRDRIEPFLQPLGVVVDERRNRLARLACRLVGDASRTANAVHASATFDSSQLSPPNIFGMPRSDYRRSLCSKAIADPEIRVAQDFLLFSYFKCLLI